MNKLVTAFAVVTMLLTYGNGAFAQLEKGGAPRYVAPYGAGGFAGPGYGTPVYGGGYGAPGYVAPGYGYSAPGYGGYVAPGYGYSGYGAPGVGYGSSWHPTAGSTAARYYNGGMVPQGYYAPPVAVSGNYFRFGPFAAGSATYWRSPSGFYYPWGAGVGVTAPVMVVQQGQSQSTKPPLSTVLNDMDRYVSEAKEKNKIGEQDYTNIERRITDLRHKLSSMMNNGDGVLDPQDDEYFRKDLDTLSREISLRVKI